MSLQVTPLINRLARGLHRAGIYISIPLLVVILSIDVCLRYVFNSPLIWGGEVSALILSIVFFASLPHVTGIDGHIRMDMLYRLMGPAAKRLTDVVTGLCGFIFAVLLTYQSLKGTLEMYRWDQGAEMVDIPYWPFVLFAGICGLILTAQFFSRMILPFIESSRGSDG
ncbi:MAG: TRAP transporter small permease [Desulfobacterales bacterium]|nr:MAG: TRAP transporter small permease [Desulfobacterales bacterium]